MLRIGCVENIYPQLQLMKFTPWHSPGFSQSQIQIDISWITEIVPRASLAGVSIAEVLVNLCDVAAAEQIGGSIDRAIGTTVYRLDGGDIGLEVPVRCPAAIVSGSRGRQPCIPAKDTRNLPPAQYRISRTTGIAHKCAPLPEGKLPDYIGVNAVPYVEIRTGVVIMLANRVYDERPIALLVPSHIGFRL